MTQGVRTTTVGRNGRISQPTSIRPWTRQDLHCRVPKQIMARLVRLQKRMSKRAHGEHVTVTEAAVKALERGLEALNL